MKCFVNHFFLFPPLLATGFLASDFLGVGFFVIFFDFSTFFAGFFAGFFATLGLAAFVALAFGALTLGALATLAGLAGEAAGAGGATTTGAGAGVDAGVEAAGAGVLGLGPFELEDLGLAGVLD